MDSRLLEFSVEVNNTFLVLTISESIVGTLILFLVLYYVYVEKTRLILNTIFYFFVSVLSLIAQSFLLGSIDGVIKAGTPQIYLNIADTLSFFIVYSLFLVMAHFLSDPIIRTKQVLAFLLPVFAAFGVINDVVWLFNFLYMVVVINVCIYHYYIELKEVGPKYIPSVVLGLSSPLIYFIFQFFIRTNYSLKARMDGYIMMMITVLFLLYFMFRYKHIVNDKDRLYKILTVDTLTGSYSKSYLHDKLTHTESGIILFIDINNFKWLNDTYGHIAGDKLLTTFALDAKQILPDNITMARYGGDEFILLATDMTLEESQMFAINLVNIFKESLKKTVSDIGDVGISIGISMYDNFESHKGLMYADQAMYKGKKNGNNKIIVNLESEVARYA